MNRRFDLFREGLENQYIFSCLSVDLQVLIGRGNLFLKNRDGRQVLIIRCANERHAGRLLDSTCSALIDEVCNPPLARHLDVLEYGYQAGSFWKSITLPIYKRMDALMMAIESSLPIVGDWDIMRMLNDNWQEQEDGSLIQLPSSFVLMGNDKCVLCSDNVQLSCGQPKAKLLAIPSNAPSFPAGELERYKSAIMDGKGSNTVVQYLAANLDSDRLFQRKVEVKLLRTTWGEVGRLVKNLEMPRPVTP